MATLLCYCCTHAWNVNYGLNEKTNFSITNSSNNII